MYLKPGYFYIRTIHLALHFSLEWAVHQCLCYQYESFNNEEDEY